MYDSIAALVRQEGWRAEGDAARVHYEGGDDRFAVEYYAGVDAVLYWTVPSGLGASDATDSPDTTSTTDAPNSTDARTETAHPVPRASVPTPLRERIRQDLAGANVDPAVERREI